MSVFTGLLGYAIGTLQVLAIDWVKRRRDHLSHLYALRAELRRVQSLAEPFNWGDEGPQDDRIPNPPTVSPAFADSVTSTECHLTDEELDDNTQEVLLTVLDGCRMLHRYHDEVEVRIDRLRDQLGTPARRRIREEALQLANEYDAKVEELTDSVQSGIQDMDRRLNELQARSLFSMLYY